MSVETVPKNLKQLRACLVCSLVKTFDQFEADGCDNCESVLHLKAVIKQTKHTPILPCSLSAFSQNFLNLIGHLIMSFDEMLVLTGCQRNRDNVYDCTSSNFEGMIASCKPEDSWVCKWQRISKFSKETHIYI